MRCVLPHARPELFPNRTLISVRRIGGADDLSPMSYGVVSLESEDDDRPAAHEFNEASEERSLPMNRVEALGFRLTQVDLAHRQHREPFVQDSLQNDALLSLFDDVRLDDCQSALDGHCGRIYTPSSSRGQNLAQIDECFYGAGKMLRVRSVCTLVLLASVGGLLLGCADLLPAVEKEEDQDLTEGEEKPERDFEADPGTCDAWKISYCDAIEQCSAFTTHEECQVDVGYVRCWEDAPVGSCEEEINQALADDDCDALPSDCTPQEIADRTVPERICKEIYNALCEHDFFCGVNVSIETCVATLETGSPCSEYTAALPQAEDCPEAIGLLSCGDGLPAECQEVLRY